MKVTIRGVDVSTLYQPAELEQIRIELRADAGEVGIGTLPVPDAAGDSESYAGEQVLLEVGDTVVADGFVGALDIDRNGLIGDRLVTSHQVADENAKLNGYVALKWRRPAETDVERIMAFHDAFLSHLGLDTDWVLNTHAVSVPKKTYTSESLFSELQEDLGKATGKTLFIERGRLHWHLYTEGIIADLAIVEAEDADWVTTFPLLSTDPPSRGKDPMDLTVKAFALNGKGIVRTAIDATAQTRHDDGGLRHEKLVEETDASAAHLQTVANVAVAEGKRERYTREGEIGPLSAAQLGDIPVGALINVTDHVWGLTSSTERIAGESIRYVHPDQFFVKLSIGYPIRIRAKPPITTPPPGLLPGDGGIPPPYDCDPLPYQLADCDDNMGPLLTPPVPLGFGGSPSPNGVYLYTGATYEFTYTIHHEHSPFYLADTRKFVEMFSDSYTMGHTTVGEEYDAGDGSNFPAVHHFAEQLTVFAGERCWFVRIGDAGYSGRDDVGSWVSVIVSYVSGPDPRFETIDACPPPEIGQLITEAGPLGDGTNTNGQTAFPYQRNSLLITIGGSRIIPTQTDPDAGTYVLPIGIPRGTTPVVTYRASGDLSTGVPFFAPPSIPEDIPDRFLAPNEPEEGDALRWHDNGRKWEPVADPGAGGGGGGGNGCLTDLLDRALAAGVLYGVPGAGTEFVQVEVFTGTSSAVITPSVTPAAGNLMVLCAATRNAGFGPTAIAGWTLVPPGVVNCTGSFTREFAMFYRFAETGDTSWVVTASGTVFTYSEFRGAGAFDASVGASDQGPTFDVVGGGAIVTSEAALIVAGMAGQGGDTNSWATATTSPSIELSDRGGLVGDPYWSAYRIEASAGTYTVAGVGTNTNGIPPPLAGVTAAFARIGTVDWLITHETNDADDDTYQTTHTTHALRLDLFDEYRIVRARLRLATETAGSRTYTVRGGHLPDWSDQVDLATVTFNATGSFIPQDVEFLWQSAICYRFVELVGNDETRRIHTFELYEADIFAGQDHSHDVVDPDAVRDAGRWEPVTNGEVEDTELVFELGDIVMEWVAA